MSGKRAEAPSAQPDDMKWEEGGRTAAASEPIVVERPLSDALQVVSYSQNQDDPTFYEEGVDSHHTATQSIFDAHGWSPYRDPAWEVPDGVSGRTAADTVATVDFR